MKLPLPVCLVLVGMFAVMFVGAPDACVGSGDNERCDHSIGILVVAVLSIQVFLSGLLIVLMYRGQ